MEQLHRRLTDEQVRLNFRNYCEGHLTRAEVEETLGVGKSQFFVLLKTYRQDPAGFSVSYQRHTPGKPAAEDAEPPGYCEPGWRGRTNPLQPSA